MKSSYDKKYKGLTDREKELMIQRDIPMVEVVGVHELTEEDKRLAEEWLAEISKQSEK